MNNDTTGRIKTLDGLRGVSIILVLLNHLGYGYFKGGYIGVDVFFVISGYVITRSIIGQWGKPDFLSSFYERRIRRLFPSLLVTILFCYCLSLFFFDISDRLAITSTVLPSIFGVSNFLFYKQAGYFDESSIEKPLLHTWSLSVEEQFYITYALVIWFLHKSNLKSQQKFAASILQPLLLLSSLASLLLSIYLTSKHASFSYFLIPTRFWEIGLGCLACLLNLRLQGLPGNLMSLLGFCLIAASCLFFNSETPYPGWEAIVPTGGSLFVILGQHNGRSIVNYILSRRFLTYIGDISYALYLVHWPVIVFATAFLPRGFSLFEQIAIVCGCIAVASMLTFKIENPVRRKRLLVARRSLFCFAASGVGLVALISFCTFHFTAKPTDKISLLIDDSVLKTILPNSGGGWVYSGTTDPSAVKTVGDDGNANTIVWGDSHAGNLFDGLAAYSHRYNLSIKFFVDYSTPPVVGLSSMNAGGEIYNSNVLNYIVSHLEITNVILTANWTAYLEGMKYFGRRDGDAPMFYCHGQLVNKKDAYNVFEQQLETTVSALSHADKSVFICTPIPTYNVNVSKAAYLMRATGRDPNVILGYSLDDYNNVNANIMKAFNKVGSKYTNATIIPLHLLFFKNGISIVAEGTNSLYSDAQHLSSYGSIFIGQQVSKIVARR